MSDTLQLVVVMPTLELPEKTVRWVLDNPVTAGIVRRWQDYRWNYCRKELLETFEFWRPK